MGKMSELSLAISELQKCGETLIEVSKALSDLFCETDAPQPLQKVPIEPAETAIFLEDVRAVLADKSRLGLTEQVRELLANHGVKKLSELPKTEYAALMEEARVLV